MQLSKTLKSLSLCIATGLLVSAAPIAAFAAEPLKVCVRLFGPAW